MVTTLGYIGGRRMSFFALLLFVLTGRLHAQEVTATARVDSNTIPLGGAIALHLEVRHPVNTPVTWPPLAEALQGLEVVRQADSSSESSGGEVTQRATFVLTGFDSGTYYVPPLPFGYRTQGDTALKAALTTAIPINVMNVQVDTAQGLKDIKPPLGVPITFAELLPWLLGLLGVLIAGYLVYYYMKKRKLGESLIPEAPARPAHEVALEALRSLDSEKMWQRGKVKDYYSQLTDIVRTYIERRFRVIAMEMTTGEILEGLKHAPLTPDASSKLQDVLVRADFVKFARYQPDEKEHAASMEEAVSFVESTWKAPATAQTSSVESGTAEKPA
jgi:hypothetical protein